MASTASSLATSLALHWHRRLRQRQALMRLQLPHLIRRCSYWRFLWILWHQQVLHWLLLQWPFFSIFNGFSRLSGFVLFCKIRLLRQWLLQGPHFRGFNMCGLCFNATLLQVCRGLTGCGDVSMRLLLSARASCSQSSILLSLQFYCSCNSAAPVSPDDPEHKMDCTPLGHIGCGLALSYCQWHLQSRPWNADCLLIQPRESDQPHETLQVTYSTMWVRERKLGNSIIFWLLGGRIPIAALMTRLTGDRLLRMIQLGGYSSVPTIANQGRPHS
jgi:hypothetical protein